MKRYNPEVAVGLFVLMGLLALAYLSIKLGNVEILGTRDYTVYAEFDSVSGLKNDAGVEIAGVTIGKVVGIALDHYRAVVTLRIRRGIELQEDAIASVRTRGIIGDKFVKISAGGSEKFISPGGKIRETESAIELEELISRFIFGKI
ncbi:MAG TPA: outer membrane lipid asymmetry maintenance protein MlaD [Nitrospiria bacterium]|nr:outer membrane lipid asymmetry maintenance protein MlaD [Nitrospiria bacterium]